MILRIALLQYPILWGNKEENLRLTEERILPLAGQADIALLPEMFTTGFCTDRPELAEKDDGETIQRLQRLSRQTGVAVAGSFVCVLPSGQSAGGRLCNRGFLVQPDASPLFYDKAHLYAHGGEDRFFVKGTERTVWDYKGVRIRMLICYDLRCPVWARNLTGGDYDLLLVSANWPECRIRYWDALIAARATENQCYIAAVNPVGDDGIGLHYNGHSIAYDTRLQPLAQFADNEEGTRIAAFDIEALHHYRQTLPLWKDADTDLHSSVFRCH